MTLVNIGNGTYVNIDLTVSIFKKGEQFCLNINDAGRSHYNISKEAYDIILSYGKASL